MATVDPLFAQWLESDSNQVVRTDAAAAARWGDTALSVTTLTPIALLADAQIEGDRQLAFMSRGPFAIDDHQLVGTDWGEELGRVVTLTVDQLGYDAGVDVMVLGVTVDRSTGISTVTVARPLRGLS